VDPVTRTFAVRVSILEPDPALQWGMTANVGIMGDGAGAAALLPLSSVYHATDGAPAVWIYDPQTRQVALRNVKLGAYRQDGVLIEAGVNQGEWVVAAGVNKLQPGQVVRPYETSGPTAAAPPIPASAPTIPASAPPVVAAAPATPAPAPQPRP
jgi:multidrug efflux pump subunit AcrA (membrane-fusion protein)